MEVVKDGRRWRVGSATDVAWLADRPQGRSVASALPLTFEAYGTVYPLPDVPEPDHERAIVELLAAHTAVQPWWLGYLQTGAHDVVFPDAPRVSLYWDWQYVLVEGGPSQALRWRTGHMRSGDGNLPDLFFPFDRSWIVSALWDDTWGCIGGSEVLIEALVNNPLAGAQRVGPADDTPRRGSPATEAWWRSLT